MKISEIPVGKVLYFGRFRANERVHPVELRWMKASEQNAFFGTSLLGSFCADAQEPENESRDRRERGSNFFPQTNICQYLNACQPDWYMPQHETDRIDETLKNRPGFLTLFDPWERDLIVPHEVITVVPAGFRRKYGETVKTTMKVSLPSKSQAGLDLDHTEGEPLTIFKTGEYKASNFLTRTAVHSGLCAINARGSCINHSPAGTHSIAPLLYLNGDHEVVFDDAEHVYLLVPPQEIVNEITDELHRLLK